MRTSSRTLTPEEVFVEREFSGMINLDIVVAQGSKRVLDATTVRLLDRINSNGTLLAAAKAVGVDFKKAQTLIHEVNRRFGTPLVVLTRGGKARGGSVLTDRGQAVLSSYQKALGKARAAAMEELYPIAKLLQPAAKDSAARFVEVREVTEIPSEWGGEVEENSTQEF